MGTKHMAEFRFLGHNCVRIKAREATVLTDPVGRNTGYVMAKQTADIVTISHDHPGHANLAAVKPDYQVVRGPGEYEMHEVFITGIRTYHDAEQGKQRGYNTSYLIELEGLRIVHLGDLGHPLSTEQTEALDDCDVLLVPVGGGNIISPEQAAETIGLLGPKVVIPLQYATAIGDKKLGDLAPFCKSLGVDVPAAEEKLVLRHSDLGETVRVVALQPESEPAKR
jgi:L-ascorbate metabolism protein UlaG (beta-lactamase superfamily)